MSVFHDGVFGTYQANPGVMQSACNCIGPRNGEPYCRCRMRGVIERDGRWIEPERDLGPVRRYDGPALVGKLADATPKSPKEPA